MPRSFVLCALLASGCVSATRYQELESSRRMSCPSDQVAVSDYREGIPGIAPNTWEADGCGMHRYCRLGVGTLSRTWCEDALAAKAVPPVYRWTDSDPGERTLAEATRPSLDAPLDP